MVLPIASSLAYLVLTHHSSLNSIQNTCLSNFYYGTPGIQSVFISDQNCLNTLSEHNSNFLTAHPALPILSGIVPHKRYVWLQQEAVHDLLLWDAPDGNNLDNFTEWLSSTVATATPLETMNRGQHVMKGRVSRYEVLTQTSTYALIAMDPSLVRQVDIMLPRFWKSTLLPESPVPYLPVPSPAIERVKGILDTVKFDPVIASIVNNISIPQLKGDIRFLTGEDPKSGIVSRHSFSEGILVAADWIKELIENTGAECTLKIFLEGFAPNVICSYPSTVKTTETVLLSAHYDSRGSFGSTRAPGGDDDGSGTISILSIARTIARKRLLFKKNVQLCLFAGEEQGLLGSRAYAREMRAADANLTLMIQADMLAYHGLGEPAQLGLPDLIGTPEVAQLVASVSAIYSPELKVGFTPACCSDHQSFHEQGFPATQVFERAGPIIDPMYHNSGDLSDRDGYDFEQVRSIAKVQFATLLHSVGFDLLDEEDDL